MNGTIEARNIAYKYDNRNDIGVEFTIKIPIN
jgi:hypothetical protein